MEDDDDERIVPLHWHCQLLSSLRQHFLFDILSLTFSLTLFFRFCSLLLSFFVADHDSVSLTD